MDPSSYQSDTLLQQYVLFHYGSDTDQMPWGFGPKEALHFPARCVREGVDVEKLPSQARAADIGCAVGRASFEMATIFDEVIGIDYSDTFVGAATHLANDGSFPCHIQEAGSITREVTIERPTSPRGALSFEQGDAQSLREDLGAFDFLLAANLLCRLQRPLEFLNRLPGLLKPGGQLVITTPNTWLEAFTAKEYWLGATPETGEPLEALKAALENDFILEKAWDMPFLIREHKRKYQWSVAQATRWIRKG